MGLESPGPGIPQSFLWTVWRQKHSREVKNRYCTLIPAWRSRTKSGCTPNKEDIYQYIHIATECDTKSWFKMGLLRRSCSNPLGTFEDAGWWPQLPPKEKILSGGDATLGIELIRISTFLDRSELVNKVSNGFSKCGLGVAQGRKHRALMRVKLTNVLVHMHKYVYGVPHVKINLCHFQPWWRGQINRYLPWPSLTEMGCDTRSSITWGTKHIQPGQKFPSPDWYWYDYRSPSLVQRGGGRQLTNHPSQYLFFSAVSLWTEIQLRCEKP